MVSRAAQRVGGGEVKTLVSRHAAGSVVLATLRDGYYLVVSLGPAGAHRGRRAPVRGSAPEAQPGDLVALLRPVARRARPHARGAGDAASGPGTRPAPARPRGARGGRAGAARRRPRSARGGRGARGAARQKRRDLARGHRGDASPAARRARALARARGGRERRAVLDAAVGRARGGRERRRQDHDHRQAGARRGRPRAAPCCSCAADTFRAAAVEQLEVWAERAGAPFHRGAEGADPSAVLFDALRRRRRRARTRSWWTPPGACTPRPT